MLPKLQPRKATFAPLEPSGCSFPPAVSQVRWAQASTRDEERVPLRQAFSPSLPRCWRRVLSTRLRSCCCSCSRASAPAALWSLALSTRARRCLACPSQVAAIWLTVEWANAAFALPCFALHPSRASQSHTRRPHLPPGQGSVGCFYRRRRRENLCEAPHQLSSKDWGGSATEKYRLSFPQSESAAL